MFRGGYIYIMTNFHREVLYVGVTFDLKNRIWQHRNHFYENSFTDKYNLEYLIYYEGFDNILEAIARENQLTKWSRKKKDVIIKMKNAALVDLSDEVMNDIYSLL